MPTVKISSDLQRFIFDNVDSIGFLETLLTLQRDPKKQWTPLLMAQELRNNPSAVESHFKKLNVLQLIRLASADSDQYIYDDSTSGFGAVIIELAEAYRDHRHKIYELIYSPLKKARDFSDAFVIQRSDKKEGEDG